VQISQYSHEYFVSLLARPQTKISNSSLVKQKKFNLVAGLCRTVSRSRLNYNSLKYLNFLMRTVKICVKKVKLSLCLNNNALRHEGVWRSGCIDPRILDLDTSWRWVVCFTHYSGKEPHYPLNRRLRRPQNRSWWCGKNKILAHTGTRTPTPQVVQSVACRYTDCATPAPIVYV
jgi:hypothetical protein